LPFSLSSGISSSADETSFFSSFLIVVAGAGGTSMDSSKSFPRIFSFKL
jgi:hypothetical protein